MIIYFIRQIVHMPVNKTLLDFTKQDNNTKEEEALDYILYKINEELELSDETSSDRFSLSRQRIEYSFVLMLGYMWYKNKDRLSPDEFTYVVSRLSRLNIGNLLGLIRILDKDHEIFKTKNKIENKLINNYPAYRNDLHGHAYVTGDDNKEVAGLFDEIYQTMIETIDILKEDIDLITITGKSEDRFEGILYCAKDGKRLNWEINEQAFPYKSDYKGSTYARVNGEYIQISPFVNILKKGKEILIFTSLEDSLSGMIKFAYLLSTGTTSASYESFSNLTTTDNNNREITFNKTIKNKYRPNYKKYFDANNIVKEKLKTALINNASNVCVTLWGHGGVGKTACIQNLIEEFCNDITQYFQYIVFVSAKDRQYNTMLGKLEKLDGGIRTFRDIILAISKTLFDGVEEKEFSSHMEGYIKQIREIKHKVLIVIDDFETFDDGEKIKIQNFIDKLDAHNHKVVITTRIKAINIGTEITTAELNTKEAMSFLSQIIESEYPKLKQSFMKLLENDEYVEIMYKSTSGRPMFLYQLAHIYASYGYNENIIKSFAQAPDARKFLYDGLYEYLSEKARLLFICISQIVDEQDYTFNYTHLQFLFSEYDSIENEIGELIKMRVVEYSSSLIYKIYSSEIYQMMKEKYHTHPDEALKLRIKDQIKQIDLTAKYETVYETWLKQANKETNEEKATKTYSKLVESTACPQEIREMAMINYVNFYVKKQDRNSVLNLYEKYERTIRGWHNAVWKFAYHLNSQPDKVCEIIESYFSYHDQQKNDYKNLDLFSLLVETRNKAAILKEVTHAELATIYNENGRLLFNSAKEKEVYEDTSNEFENIEAIRHHMAKAIASSVRILVKLIEEETDVKRLTSYKESALEMCEFGLEHFTKYGVLISELNRFKLQVGESKTKMPDKICFEDFISKHNKEDIYEFTVTNASNERGFLYGNIDWFNCIIPRRELPRAVQDDLSKYYSKGSKLYVKIKDIIPAKNQIHLRVVN